MEKYIPTERGWEKLKGCSVGSKRNYVSYFMIESSDTLDPHWVAYDSKDQRVDNCFGHGMTMQDFQPLNSIIKINKSFMGKLVNMFNNLFTPEPQKTFSKVGITDDQGNLTTEGTQLYLQWKLKQDQTAFKTEVADPLLAAIEAENKK